MNIYVLEDHPLVLHGLESIIGSAFPEVKLKSESDLHDAMDGIGYNAYDLAIVDLCIKGKRSFDFLEKSTETNQHAKHLVFTSSIRKDYYDKALACGVDGYLVKECTPDDLVYAIKTVLKGRKFIDPIFHEIQQQHQAQSPTVQLTDREKEILKMIGQGLTNRQIAELTYITVNTVKKHITNILNKMEFKNRKQAILYCQHHYI